MKYCFGVDVGGTTVKLGFFSELGELIDQWEVVTRVEEQGKYILSDVAKSIQDKMNQHKVTKDDIVGVGIGVPGPVLEDGTVLQCVNLGWGIVQVEKELKDLLDIPVKVGNDANVAALGEAWQGGGKGYSNIVMVTLGTGVGGGIILNNQILTGTKGAAGEIGHILVNYEEVDSCNCGKCGCLEQYASATGIVKETKRILNASLKDSALRKIESFTAKDIFDCAKAGDELSMEAVEVLCKYLGIALSHVAAVVDPQAFVIGGGVSKAGNILTEKISQYYDERVMMALKNKVFCLATLGNDAGIYGSAKLALEIC